MKIRIEIKRSYDRVKRERIKNPILVKEPGQEPYSSSGALLCGPSEVFYKPHEHPRTYLEVDGRVSRVDTTVNRPKEDKTGKTTYVNILLSTIDGNRGKEVPERVKCPCPCLLKQRGGTPEYGHHIRISGPSKIVSSLTKPIRSNVFVWIETESNVDCTNENRCFCTGLQSELWPGFCPRLLSLPPDARRRTRICPRLPNLPLSTQRRSTKRQFS
jgi:hypothetical protein